MPTSVLLAVLAAAALLALAPALVRRYDATERLAAERAESTARVLDRRRRRRTVPGPRPMFAPRPVVAIGRAAPVIIGWQMATVETMTVPVMLAPDWVLAGDSSLADDVDESAEAAGTSPATIRRAVWLVRSSRREVAASVRLDEVAPSPRVEDGAGSRRLDDGAGSLWSAAATPAWLEAGSESPPVDEDLEPRQSDRVAVRSAPARSATSSRRSDVAIGRRTGSTNRRGARPQRVPQSPAVRRRRRVLASLVLFNTVELIGVFTVSPGFWTGFAVTLLMLVAYVVHLRNEALVGARRRRAAAERAAVVEAVQAEIREEQARRAAARKDALRRAAAARASAQREAVQLTQRYVDFDPERRVRVRGRQYETGGWDRRVAND
ncbi:MAG TPA: hypothetical protein VFR11_21470 [Micromonosporaceae bacterium]|nr:hypothetical protein [Micromonosporaceae bacterium]